VSDDYTLGIDLGTSRSAMAFVPDGEPEIIENSEGKPVTPSIVHLTEEGEALVGDAAVNQMLMQPERTKREVKKLMGDNETIELGEETYNPQEVSALILQKLVEDAEQRLGGSVSNAVITVPAYFTDRQRNATREAGEIAGLEVDRLLPEPSAAVLAYGLREQRLGEATDEIVFVYDLGGGTFDATLVDAAYEHNIIETIATDGDTALGGTDWTQAIVDFICDIVEEDTGIDIRENDDHVESRKRVREAAVEAKHQLSEQQKVHVTVPAVIPSADGMYNVDEQLSREAFESMTADLIERTKEPIDDIFERTDYDRDDVDKVLLVGGSTRMPQVEDMVEEYFEVEPSKQISPDKAVALGAAVQAAVLDDDADATLPASDEEAGGLVLIEALPQSIGVKIQPGNRFDPIIERDTEIPATERKEGYTVEHEDQTAVSIKVYQGDADTVDDNEYLGEAILKDIPKRERGADSLAVEFSVDMDGTLEVRGEDLLSGKEVTTELHSALESDAFSRKNLPPNA
jgi:molecular chaperone DnaK